MKQLIHVPNKIFGAADDDGDYHGCDDDADDDYDQDYECCIYLDNFK